MKRKKSRHKVIAVDFLSSISLDGCYQREIFASHETFNAVLEQPTTVAERKSQYIDVFRNTVESKARDLCPSITEQVRSFNPTSPSNEDDCKQSSVLVHEEALSQYADNSQQRFNVENRGTYIVTNANTFSLTPYRQADCTRVTLSVDAGDTERHTTTLSGKLNPQTDTDRIVTCSSPSSCFVESPPKGSRRITIYPLGLPRTRLAVFSVIPYGRKSSHPVLRNAVRIPRLTPSNVKVSVDLPTLPVPAQGYGKQSLEQTQPQPPPSLQPPPPQQQPSQRPAQPQTHIQQSTSNSSGSNEPLLVTFVGDPLRSLSSMRPIGDEVVSFSQFLKPQVNLWLSNPEVLGPTDGRAISSSEIPFHNALRSNFLGVASSNRAQVRHLSATASLGSAPHWSRTTQMFARARNSSGGSNSPLLSTGGLAGVPLPGTSAAVIAYPDPLIYYIPSLLDDPDLLVATGKRVLKLPNYLTSVITYVKPSEQKRNVNREFHERFPMIQLTLTKLRSIKSVLVRVIQRLSLDLWIAAHAHVLFEKLILRLLVNKTNRRLCASAVLLLSAKLNDVKGPELSALLQELENNFKISRRDLVRTELDVALSLEFCLVPNEQEIVLHYIRIYKNLDLAPPYPLTCLGQLPHSTSLPSVTVHEQSSI